MDIVIEMGGVRDATSSEYRNKAILFDITHADPQARVHMRDGSADQDGSAASTSAARKRNYNCLLYTSPSPRDKRQSRMPSSA